MPRNMLLRSSCGFFQSKPEGKRKVGWLEAAENDLQ
jgi:hypothetical protein